MTAGSRSERGFTLVEIMIVVTIIGMLAAISIPSFARARTTAQKNACINNLRQLSGAKDQWAIENFMGDSDPVDKDQVALYIKGGMPNCPANGEYMFMNVRMNPTCTIAFHVLDNHP